MASLAGMSTKPLSLGGGNPQNSIYGALATGNQSGLSGAGSQGTNNQLNNTFYQQGVANPWYQANQGALNRTSAAYQPGGMFYNPSAAPAGTGIGSGLGGGVPAGGNPMPPTGIGSGLGGGSAAAGPLPPVPTTQPGGNVQPAGGAQPDWSTLDINKFMQPNVDFLIGQGSKAIQNSAAAKGGLLSGNTLQGVNDYAQNTAQQAYGAAQNAAMNDRSFMAGQYNNQRDYQTALDQWNQNFGQNQYQFNTGANQFQQQFGQNQYQFNTGANQWQQQFNYGVDNNDRNFAYNAMNGDRNFNSQLGLNLAQLGMQGSGQQNLLNQWLGNMLAGNNLSIGQTNANATIGGNNATNNSISQFIQQLLSQGMLNRFAPPTGGP